MIGTKLGSGGMGGMCRVRDERLVRGFDPDDECPKSPDSGCASGAEILDTHFTDLNAKLLRNADSARAVLTVTESGCPDPPRSSIQILHSKSSDPA